MKLKERAKKLKSDIPVVFVWAVIILVILKAVFF